MTREEFFTHLQATQSTMAWRIDTCGTLRGWYLGFPDGPVCCPITAVANALHPEGCYLSPDLWDSAAAATGIDLGFAHHVVLAADNQPDGPVALRRALLEATGLKGGI